MPVSIKTIHTLQDIVEMRRVFGPNSSQAKSYAAMAAKSLDWERILSVVVPVTFDQTGQTERLPAWAYAH